MCGCLYVSYTYMAMLAEARGGKCSSGYAEVGLVIHSARVLGIKLWLSAIAAS